MDVSRGLLFSSSAAGAAPSGPYDGVVISDWTSNAAVKAFRLSYNSGWGSAVTSPALPSTTNRTMAFSPTGAAVTISSAATGNYINAWAWSNSTGFGTPYSNPVSQTPRSHYTSKFTNSGSHIFVTYSAIAPYISAYSWSDSTGFGSIISPASNPPSITTTNPSIDVAPDDSAVVFTINSPPEYLFAYAFDSSTGFGAAYSYPSVGVGSYVREVAFSPNNDAIAVAHNTSPYLTVYSWNSSTGFGSKYTSPSITTSQGTTVTFSKTGAAIFFSGTSRRQAWAWNSSTGFGAAYSNPASATENTSTFIMTNTNDMVVGIGSSFAQNIHAYQWSDSTGFGTYYPSPQTGWNGQGGGAVSPSS